jgi:hypothetical protein
MTKAEALGIWRECCMPAVRRHYEQDGVPDYPARCESWGAFTDGLCKDGCITDGQYSTWSAPRECGS